MKLLLHISFLLAYLFSLSTAFASPKVVVSNHEYSIQTTAFTNEIQANYPNFYKNWQKISLGYGIGRLTQVGLEMAYNQCRSEVRMIIEDPAISTNTKTKAQQIENKLNDESVFGGWVNG